MQVAALQEANNCSAKQSSCVRKGSNCLAQRNLVSTALLGLLMEKTVKDTLYKAGGRQMRNHVQAGNLFLQQAATGKLFDIS